MDVSHTEGDWVIELSIPEAAATRKGIGVFLFDGPPIVSCLAFSLHNGKLTEPVGPFDHPYWDWVRENIARKAHDIRGFLRPAMFPYADTEYEGITERMGKLAERFHRH